MKQPLSLRIRLFNPPLGVAFGLQEGSGHTYTTVQTQQTDAPRLLQFTCTVQLRHQDRSRPPVFSGPAVQGPAAAQFVYLDIGTSAGQVGSVWSRRLKIPLTGISWESIDQLSANPAFQLLTEVAGTGKDGGPACGTVKPFGGWQVQKVREDKDIEQV